MRKLLTKEEQEEYLYNKIGDPVNFTYPKGEGDLSGKLLDRVVVFDGEDDFVLYWNMIDLIEFSGEDEDWLRLTYYRCKKKDRRWVFAGQTSISDPISCFEELFTKAIKSKVWMRHLFSNIYKQCKKELDLEKL